MANRLLPTRLRMEPRLTPGRVFVSSGASDALDAVRIPLVHILTRHMRGDWGSVSDEDWRRNDLALVTEHHLLSSYILSSGRKIWIHTTCKRSATLVFLPAEALRLEIALRLALVAP